MSLTREDWEAIGTSLRDEVRDPVVMGNRKMEPPTVAGDVGDIDENVAVSEWIKDNQPTEKYNNDEFVQKRRSSFLDLDTDEQCGFFECGQPPRLLQRLATRHLFLTVFCLSSVVQGMFYPYFISCLTTIEKLFQISSQTTGVIMSTTEIGQIGGSLWLTYYGGGGHRPRWIASSMIFVGISVFLCGLPHFLFGEELVNQYLSTAPTQEDPLSTANICLDYELGSNLLLDEEMRPENASFPHQNFLLPCTSPSKYTKIVLGLFAVALLGVGIGQPAIYNLGIPYIDDNVASQDSPTYFGTTIGIRILGPTLGFVLGSLCMRLPIDPFSKSPFYQTDPRWIGAWWLGLVFISVSLIAISLIMMLFPKRLPSPARPHFDHSRNKHHSESSKITKNNIPRISNKGSYTALQRDYTLEDIPDLTSHSTSADSTCFSASEALPCYDDSSMFNRPANCEYVDDYRQYLQTSKGGPSHSLKEKRSLKNFVKVLRRLATNRIMLLRTFSSVFHLLPISGLYTFLPKYLETQFRVSVHSAAMISGVGGILVMGFGIFFSGFVIRKLNPSPRAVTFWIALTAAFYSVGMVILLFLGCPHDDFVGRLEEKGTDSYFMPPCERQCGTCDETLFSPICSSEGKTYFSACHAGCTTVSLPNNSKELIFSECECLEEGSTASLRLCDSHCTTLTWYVVVFCIFAFIHSTSEVGGMLVTLRCVQPDDKAMALGFISVAIGLFGNVPCPILYGAIIDYACILWRESCNGIGACQLYDLDVFRTYFHGITAGLMLVAFFVDVAVWHYAKSITFQDKETNGESTILTQVTGIRSSSVSSLTVKLSPVTSTHVEENDGEGISSELREAERILSLQRDVKLRNNDFETSKLCPKRSCRPISIEEERFVTFQSSRLSTCGTSSLSRLDERKKRPVSLTSACFPVVGEYPKLPLLASTSTPLIENRDCFPVKGDNI